MLAYIKGTLEIKASNYIVIDVGGLGYKVFMSDTAINELNCIGEQIKVHTYYRVREDDISIYGFLTKEELRMFELLLQVSGVGAKVALAVLSNIAPSEFALAVISNDVTKLTKIPGIGAKSAQRIVLELKDKLKKEENIGKEPSVKVKQAIQDDNKVIEAVTALQVLGYTKKDIDEAFEKMDKANLSVEELIKKGLVLLSQ